MSRHSRIQEATNLNRGPPLPDSFSLNSGTSFIATNLPSTQDHSYLDNPSAIPPASATFLKHKVEHVISTQNTINTIKNSINNNVRKPAVAYTGLTGAGYTLSGQTGRFLLPANSVAHPQDGAGTLDVWPAGKSALSASSAANKQERKRHRNRAKGSGSSIQNNNNNNSSSSSGVQHETGSQPKLLQELDQFITSELNVLGIDCGSSSEPNAARLQVYREAFRHFMEEFKTYKPFLSSVKNEYDSVLDKYARRLHYIPALRARLSTMEASTKQRVRREADAHSAEIRRIRITVRATEERLKSMEELNEKLINDNVKITKELDLQRTRYLDMKTANVSIVASLKKKDYIINDGQGDKRKQEERATKLANQLEQLELKHDVVLIQLANLRNKHLKLTQSGTTQNVERLENEVEMLQKEQAVVLKEHEQLSKTHSETLLLVEKLTKERDAMSQEIEQMRNDRMEAQRNERSDERRGSRSRSRTGGTPPMLNEQRRKTMQLGGTKDFGDWKIDGKNNDGSGSRGATPGIGDKTRGKGGGRRQTFVIGGKRNSNSTNSGSSNSSSNSNSNSSNNRNNRSVVSQEVWNKWLERCTTSIGLKLPPEYKALTKKKSNVSYTHVANLMNGLLSTLEHGSFVTTDPSSNNNNPKLQQFATGQRGVPIAELRRLMKRMPPWKRKKDARAVTSEITSISTVTTSKHKEGEDVTDATTSTDIKSSMYYFVGRGVDPEIPIFLRFNGRIRNRHLSKAEIEKIVKIVWIRKEQSRNKDHLSDFFHTYLQDEYGPSQTIIAEQAYNIVHSLERYNHDADCDMFLKILMGELPEQSFVDQQLLLQHLQDKIIKLDRSENQGIQTGKIDKQIFLACLKKCVPCKTVTRMEELQQALFYDCGGPVKNVNYIDVFQDDHEGNQGKFVEAMRDQYLEESIEYSYELVEALESMASNTSSSSANGSGSSKRVSMVLSSGGLNLNQLREAFLSVDPSKSLGEVDELIARGCGIDVDEIETLDDSFEVDVKLFVKKLKTGILTRSGLREEA